MAVLIIVDVVVVVFVKICVTDLFFFPLHLRSFFSHFAHFSFFTIIIYFLHLLSSLSSVIFEYYLFLFLIRSCSHWILHTVWWCCVDLYCCCFWYLHEMYIQIKYCLCKWRCNYKKYFTLDIYNFFVMFFCTSKTMESKIIHKEKILNKTVSFMVVHPYSISFIFFAIFIKIFFDAITDQSFFFFFSLFFLSHGNPSFI